MNEKLKTFQEFSLLFPIYPCLMWKFLELVTSKVDNFTEIPHQGIFLIMSQQSAHQRENLWKSLKVESYPKI